MMDQALAELAWVALLPLAVAASSMLTGKWFGLRPRTAWATSVAAGFVVGKFGLASRAGLNSAIGSLVSPPEAADWLPWAVLLAAGATVWANYSPSAWRGLAGVVAALLVLSTPARLLGGSAYVVSQWSLGERIVYLALLAAAVGSLWWLLQSDEDGHQPLVRGLLLIFVAVGMAATLTLSGSFTYGELGGVVAATLTGALLASMAGVTGIGGAAGPLTMSLGGLILLGHFYAELSPSTVALLTLSLIAAGARLPKMPPLRSGWQALMRVAICVVPLMVAVARAYAATQTAAPY